MKEKKYDINKKILFIVVRYNGRIEKRVECDYTEELENSLKEIIKVLNNDDNDRFEIEYDVKCGFNLIQFLDYTARGGITYNIKHKWFTLRDVNETEIVNILKREMLRLPVKSAEYEDHTIDSLSQYGGTWNIEIAD